MSPFVIPKVEGLNVEINVGEGSIKGLMEARGKVSGAKGSYENGTPNTTADITFAVDISNPSPGYLNNLRDNVVSLTNEMKSRGLQYNLRLVAFDGSGVRFTSENYGQDESAFIGAIDGLPADGSGDPDFGAVVSEIAGTPPFAKDANRYLFVYTGESIGGDGISVPDATIEGYVGTMKRNNVKVSVVTASSKFEDGDPSEQGWDAVTKGTGGSLYDIASADYAALLSKMGADTALDVNKGIVTVDESLDIISSVKKMLNAVVNVVAREVNRLCLSGTTLNGGAGVAFFEAVEAGIPMEMGNIRVSDAVKDLNNIVASLEDSNGDNEIALKIAHLRNESLMEGYTQTLSVDDYYQYIILRVGNMGNDAEQIAENQQALVNAADNNRQTTMGVSLDEEMSNMIKFKYAYNAATKTISVINEMLDTLIHRTGLSGR